MISENTITALFAEELGIVLEVSESHQKDIVDAYEQTGVQCIVIGRSVDISGPEAQVTYTF